MCICLDCHWLRWTKALDSLAFQYRYSHRWGAAKHRKSTVSMKLSHSWNSTLSKEKWLSEVIRHSHWPPIRELGLFWRRMPASLADSAC